MKRWPILVCALLALLLVSGAAPGAGRNSNRLVLDMYRATVSQSTFEGLRAKGVDIAHQKAVGDRVQLDLVLTPGQAEALAERGVQAKLIRNKKGQTVRQMAAAQAVGGFTVWRDYDSPNGLRAYLYGVARNNPQITKLEVIGHTHQGREIIAIKMTQGARDEVDGSRPAVLYSATQHAREWIAPEVAKRDMDYFIAQWRANNKQIKDMLKNRELWFILVMNPDGYQYTFESPDTRLWRKNTREQNGVPGTQVGDGVDPNRNYPSHWDYDREGSSSIESSDTYRGPSAGSEPETQAIMGLFDRIPFRFQINYHSFGPWLLYPQGWQIGTPTADDPIFYALSGNLDNPAIPDFYPGLSSDVLYVTNGEMTDYANARRGTIAWTPELEPGCDTCGFVFPDNEALVQQEFEKQLPFALDVAKSALDPAHPVSHLGLTARPLLIKSDDTYKAGLPTLNFTFDYSYGDPQEVRVDALRSLGPVSVKYRINGGPIQTAPTTELTGGSQFAAESAKYYHVMHGWIAGTNVGDHVQVWFEGGGAQSDSFTYEAVNETSHDTLVVASEDRTGQSPPGAPAPPAGGPGVYTSYYVDALAANGITADVYDVDTHNREAADALGVLSHYKAVIVEKGDDVVTREPGWGGGNASRIAQDEMFELREFMNEGGRAMYAGKNAGLQYAQAQLYDPTAANGRCGDPTVIYRCLQLNGTGDGMNDVLQYWFGSYLVNLNSGLADDGSIFDAFGTDIPLDGVPAWSFNGADSAQNQNTANSFIATSGILPASEYPQFDSWVAAKYDRPGGPFDPHDGTKYAYSQIADQSFKRITHTVNVPAGGADMTFWTSYNTEQDWDMVFVEEHTVGQDNWTTLEDLNGNTTQSTGESCKPENGPGGWRTIHPFMDHYQTIVGDDCEPHGTTGEWWATNGNSGDWQQWHVDLAGPDSRFLGQQVEVSITYVSDWSTQGLGVFVDEISISTGEGTTSFESGNDGWQMPPAPAGSATNANTWEVTDSAGFPEGAVIAGPNSLLWGFGLEGVTDAARRTELMGRAITYLRRP